ncbi:type II toxin-antitoxin system VapC family toxin [Neolewinella lacunae]|uniref:Type II toxin-antitoxin system VapC family toxin n=1 Tax=Neolewinella lacunae TaxID=1517758 RepID=A0A923PKK1_9BACT|nr:type II toxin-antitoxin system VapC family toxin [Neolewinella lacunae]MBC6995843.1 type II toxin-antitoxin system VapC family toxin [Neolewinella lacunae]MDN3636464.1 type II toxin-antitoxin system VapC family toxin [Neolewinella lacunae]
MISYFDTTVLLAALITKHELHEKAKARLQLSVEGGTALTTTTHAFAELYRNISKPTSFGIHLPPAAAAEAIINGIGRLLTVVELYRADYEAAIRRCEELNLTGAVIYDALHYQAALKGGAEVIYTDNLKDFTRLQKEGETIRVEGIR